ncbi:MAG: glycerol-3-phosphate dehydrogenase/oxidase, partial [Acidimicrobiia bacterium]
MTQDSSALNPTQRSRDLARMGEAPLDMLVIGGGVTGAGTALDAATRGLNVGLVEQRDYASGTSSRSSKMFHGGLRYLEQFNFGLVSEALQERNLMLKTISPHLAKPISIVYPLKSRFWERLYVGTGVWIYDLMARTSSSPLPHHEHLSAAELAELAPAIDQTKTNGAIRYWDALVDDARHTLTVARTAAAHGASLATSARAVHIDTTGSLPRAELVDLESGSHIGIEARVIVNATGVWSDDIQGLAGQSGLDVEASKGIHLVVPAEAIESETGMILRTNASVLFVIPWGDHWIIGTTDTPWSLGRAHPAASRSDIAYLIEWVNTVLAHPISERDIVGVYAGLRPLLTGESDETSKLSREHAVIDSGSGLISVAGGKYTTYRVMAKDAVDAAAPYLSTSLPESRTAALPLVGADTVRWVRGDPPPVDMDPTQRQR